tara:strand:+ start:92 stop:862 length:771 start_codon:yes stop_codon:yes gene_type:complete
MKKFKIKEIKELLKPKNLLEFNRDISYRHTNAMIQSITECGILRLPVIGDISKFDKRKYVIIDGQHLCNAIIQMPKNLFSNEINEINCIVKVYDNKNNVISDVAKLNNIQKSWRDENYLNAWYKFGKDNVDYFANYAYLSNTFNNIFEGLSCGFLVDLYATNKESFRNGKLEFRDQIFSDKLAQLSYMLKIDYNKNTFALQGLIRWAFSRKYDKFKEIDFNKLGSRLKLALINNEDKYCNHRDDFADFVNTIYNRI